MSHDQDRLQSARSLAKTLCGDKTAVKFPLMPIVVKTAVCPVAVLLPDNADDGQWQIEAEGKNITAKFINKDGKLTGFALTGDKVKLRVSLMKQMQL